MGFEYRGEPYDVSVHVYRDSPVCMALAMHGADPEDGYGLMTVNLGADAGNETIMPLNCAFIDENNYPGLGMALQDAGLAEPYMRFGGQVFGQSGFVEYPLYQFKGAALKELDPNGYAVYADGYGSAWQQAYDEWFGSHDPWADVEMDAGESATIDDEYQPTLEDLRGERLSYAEMHASEGISARQGYLREKAEVALEYATDACLALSDDSDNLMTRVKLADQLTAYANDALAVGASWEAVHDSEGMHAALDTYSKVLDHCGIEDKYTPSIETMQYVFAKFAPQTLDDEPHNTFKDDVAQYLGVHDDGSIICTDAAQQLVDRVCSPVIRGVHNGSIPASSAARDIAVYVGEHNRATDRAIAHLIATDLEAKQAFAFGSMVCDDLRNGYGVDAAEAFGDTLMVAYTNAGWSNTMGYKQLACECYEIPEEFPSRRKHFEVPMESNDMQAETNVPF